MRRLGIVLLVGCSGGARPSMEPIPEVVDAGTVDSASLDATTPPPEAYLLRFGILEVAPYRVSSNGVESKDHWDGEVVESVAKSGLCSTLGTLVGGAAGAVVGGLPGAAGGATVGEKMGGVLCPQKKQTAQRERDPRAPDVRVVLLGYATPVEQDTYLEDLGYALIVPRAAVPASGLVLRVEDREQNGEAEKIAIVTLPLAELDRAARVGGLLSLPATGSLARLEVSVSAAPPPASRQLRIPATEGLALVADVEVIAGQTLQVRATGSYKLAKDYPAIGPEGGGPGKKKIAEPVFGAAAPGVAIAVSGEGEWIDRVVVGACASWTASYSGRLILGINDAQRSDNSGDIEFEVEVRPANVDEWKSAGLGRACQ